jgi:anaerobic selenocysteine-containing dehydrogenase
MGAVVRRSREVIEKHTALAMAFYTSGQLFAEEYYTQAMIARGGIGTSHLDGNTRLCTATAEWALIETFGSDGDPGSHTDIDACDTLFLVGHNVAETQTVLWMRMLDRLHAPDRPRLVVIDPRVTAVARQADVHLAVLPGTNVAVLNAILHEMIANGWVDHEWMRQHTVGYEDLADVVAKCPAEEAARICGVEPESIREAAHLLGTGHRLVSPPPPAGLAAGAAPHPVGMRAGTPLPGRLRCVPHRDRAGGRRRAAGRAMGGEDRLLHQRRPDRAPFREGGSTARAGAKRPRHAPRLRRPHGLP